jgi:hypothetical protein
MMAFAPISAQALEAMLSADASGTQELNRTAPEIACEAGGTELPESAGGPDVAQPASPSATAIQATIAAAILIFVFNSIHLLNAAPAPREPISGHPDPQYGP